MNGSHKGQYVVQLNGATCRTANETIQSLHKTLPGRVLSRFGRKNWSPSPPRMGLFEIKSMPYKNNLNAAPTKFSHNYIENQ